MCSTAGTLRSSWASTRVCTKEAGFDVQITPATGSGFVVAAIDSGKADYGMADVSSAAQGIAKGAKVKAFMVYTDVTTNGLASLQPYPTPESVVGKKIAASETDSVRVILPIIFDAKKLDVSSIKWQAADPSVYFSLLLSGQVDLFTATSDGDVPALTKVASAQGKTVPGRLQSFAETLYDLADIGRGYAQYRGMMAHWARVLPGRVVDVDHEALVADPGRQIRWLVTEACGLAWNDACLRPEHAAGAVRTASAVQVREPINAAALGRWRRYQPHLGPLLDALGPYGPG